MSYILDALKKSEQERQRGNVPDIKSVHNTAVAEAPDTRRGWWIWLFIAVLVVNGLIFTVAFLGGDGDSPPDAGGQAANLAAPAGEGPARNLAQTVTKSPPLKSPGASGDSTAVETTEGSLQPPQTQPRVVFSTEPLDDTGGTGETIAPARASRKPEVDALPAKQASKQAPKPARQTVLISELPDSIRQKIPSMEFSGHIYSTTVERRSVMINGKKMREGDVVAAGLLLQAVTPDGAEFVYQGYRFKLGALQDYSYR
ncbi:MAG TPA: general secretion pathway protein GspB [Gammaproteobacteria bacterium]